MANDLPSIEDANTELSSIYDANASLSKSEQPHLLQTVTDIIPEIGTAYKHGLQDVKEGFSPYSDSQKTVLGGLKATGKGIMGLGEVAAAPITGAGTVTDIFPEIGTAYKHGLQDVKEGFSPYSDSQKTVLGGLKATGKGIMGLGEVAASPITGAGRSIFGHLLAAPGQISYDEAKNQADLAMMALRPKTGFRPSVPMPPRPTTGPFGVTLSEGQETRNLAAIQQEQAALRNSKLPGHEEAQAFREQQQQQLEQARESVNRAFDPNLQVQAETPQQAGQLVQQRLRAEADFDRAYTDAHYENARQYPGEVHAGAFEGIGTRIKGDLTLSPPVDEEPVIIDDLTPVASSAIHYLDNWPSRLRIKNLADPFGQPNPENITGVNLAGLDQWRKNLVARRRAAFASGNPADARAMQRIIQAFDERVDAAINGGLYNGPPEAIQAWNDARAAHANYRSTFRVNGKGDQVGAELEKITGHGNRAIGNDLSPNDVADALYSSAGVNPSSKNVNVATRVRDILGTDSREWAAVKQGLFQRLTADAGPGRTATRLERFLNTDGVELSRAIFTPGERQMLGNYSALMRQIEVPPTGANWSNTSTFTQRLRNAGSWVGMIIGHKLGLPFPIGEAAGYAIGRGTHSIADARQALQISRQMPLMADRIRQWQQAVARVNRLNSPPNQKAANVAAANLISHMNRIGVPQSLLLAGAEENKNQAPGPGSEHKYGGRVSQKHPIHGYRVGGRVAQRKARVAAILARHNGGFV